MLTRELALYRRLAEQGVEVTLVSEGGPEEERFRSELGAVHLWCNRDCLDPQGFRQSVLDRLAAQRGTPALFKSNQIWGAEFPAMAAQAQGGFFIARCGYLLSDFMTREHGQGSEAAHQAQALEFQVFSRADACVVTTPAMALVLKEGYGIPEERLHVIPNYVDTEAFSPGAFEERCPEEILFIGRLHEQKNVFALLEAIAPLPVRLTLIGDGSLRVRLRRQIRQLNLDGRMLGNLPHAALVPHLRQCGLFVLPSLYEGHPKTLLEAMACGCPIVATEVSGIRSELRHEVNGYLCGVDVLSLRGAIAHVLAHPAEARLMGERARDWAVQQVSLERVVQQEQWLVERLMSCPPRSIQD
jgi:glycosyltransferase involved in cell wall biosynthesis